MNKKNPLSRGPRTDKQKQKTVKGDERGRSGQRVAKWERRTREGHCVHVALFHVNIYGTMELFSATGKCHETTNPSASALSICIIRIRNIRGRKNRHLCVCYVWCLEVSRTKARCALWVFREACPILLERILLWEWKFELIKWRILNFRKRVFKPKVESNIYTFWINKEKIYIWNEGTGTGTYGFFLWFVLRRRVRRCARIASKDVNRS